MSLKQRIISALGGLGILGAAAATAQAQEDPVIPSKNRVTYEHSFLDYESKRGEGQGQRDLLDLRLQLEDNFSLDALFRRTRYTGSNPFSYDTFTIPGTAIGGNPGQPHGNGNGWHGGTLPPGIANHAHHGNGHTSHGNGLGLGHTHHGNGFGYGHPEGDDDGNGGGNDDPGDDGSSTPGSTGMLYNGADHTDVENYFELGFDASCGKLRFDAAFLYSDNLDARHLFRADDVEGLGFKLGLGFQLNPDFLLGLEARVMDLEPGGTNTGLAARAIYQLGRNDQLLFQLSGMRDDLRDCMDYQAALALRHAFSDDVAVKLGGMVGREDFSSKSPYSDSPTWGISGGIEGRLLPGVFLEVGLGYTAGTVDERTGTVGISVKW